MVLAAIDLAQTVVEKEYSADEFEARCPTRADALLAIYAGISTSLNSSRRDCVSLRA